MVKRLRYTACRPCMHFPRVLALLLALYAATTPTFAQGPNNAVPRPVGPTAGALRPPNRIDAENEQGDLAEGLVVETVRDATSPTGMSASLKLMALLTIITLAPSILLMTTCFVRFVIVFGLLRQALGTQQLPPNQVVTSLCLFLTLMVMAPHWRAAYTDGIEPYTAGRPIQTANGEYLQPVPLSAAPADRERLEQARLQQAVTNAMQPLRNFMIDQIYGTQNHGTVIMLLEYQRPAPGTPEAENYQPPEDYRDVPLSVLIPAYMLSELKTAFIIGFQIYLPFIVIDMVISTILISMGMMMLPPVLISLPFKLLLFVLIDGWSLSVGMLLESVTQFG